MACRCSAGSDSARASGCAAAALVALGPLLAILYVRYQLSRFSGRLIDANLLLALAGGSPLEWFAQASAQLVPVAADDRRRMSAGAAPVRATPARERRPTDGRAACSRRAAQSRSCSCRSRSGLMVAGGGILLEARHRGGVDYDALGTKTSGLVLTCCSGARHRLRPRRLRHVLDGRSTRRRSTVAQHPYALDVPGNGIDENGLAGDHPARLPRAADELDERPVFGARPNVLIVFLEGVRADMVGASLGDREIMPFLNRSRARARTPTHAFANSPYTAPLARAADGRAARLRIAGSRP